MAGKILLTVIHMDFPAFRTHNSISPEESTRQAELYLGDLKRLRDVAAEILAEMDGLDKVNEDDNDLIEEVVVSEGLHVPDAIVQLGARQKTSLSIS